VFRLGFNNGVAVLGSPLLTVSCLWLCVAFLIDFWLQCFVDEMSRCFDSEFMDYRWFDE